MNSTLITESRWQREPIDSFLSLDNEEYQSNPFHINLQLNSKLHLCIDNGLRFPSNALIIGQNEHLNDKSDENQMIMELAGPIVEQDLANASPIQTGESTIVRGGYLPFDWLICAVAPRYDEHYLTACEQALYSSYYSSFLLAIEQQAESITINCLYLPRKKYPRFDAAHITLRTLRKFLNHDISFSLKYIYLCVTNQEDFEIYSILMTAYFPRNQEELTRQKDLLLLPDKTDEWGNIILEDRTVKITSGPRLLSSDNDGITSKTKSGISILEGKTELLKKKENNDDERRLRISNEILCLPKNERLELRYKVYLKEITNEEFDSSVLDCINIIGKDRKGRSIVSIYNLDYQIPQEQDSSTFIKSIMTIMEQFRCRPYVLIIYFTIHKQDFQLEYERFMELCDLFYLRYKENLQEYFVFHLDFTSKLYLNVSSSLIIQKFWKKIHYCQSMVEVNDYMDISTLSIPKIPFNNNYPK